MQRCQACNKSSWTLDTQIWIHIPIIDEVLKSEVAILHFVFNYAPFTYKEQHMKYFYALQKYRQKPAILCYQKATPCIVSKKNLNTKEEKGKSMIRALHILWWVKRHISRQSSIKQWKNQACSLTHICVVLGWRYQLVN